MGEGGGGREALGTRLLKTYNDDQVKMKAAERGLCFEFVMSSQTSYLKVVLDIYLAIAVFPVCILMDSSFFDFFIKISSERTIGPCFLCKMITRVFDYFVVPSWYMRYDWSI